MRLSLQATLFPLRLIFIHSSALYRYRLKVILSQFQALQYLKIE